MINRLKSSIIKRLLLYVVFGALTTVINIFLFWLLADVLHVQYLISNFLSIVFSIFFAYITNKWYVFKSKTETKKELISECIIFIGTRTSTLIFDMVGMFVLVSFINLDLLVSKVFVSIVVVILNYVFSRLWVFKKDE